MDLSRAARSRGYGSSPNTTGNGRKDEVAKRLGSQKTPNKVKGDTEGI